MKSILKFILFSNFWVGFNMFVLSFGLYRFFNVENGLNWSILNGVATVIAYLFHRIIRVNALKEFKNERISWIQKNNLTIKCFIAIGILFYAYLFTTLVQLNYSLILPFLATIISFLYVYPIGYKNLGLRNIPQLKAHLISGTWIMILFFPVFNSTLVVENKVIIGLMLALYCAVFVQIIPFDSRDIKYDDLRIKTLPQQLGLKKVILLGLILSFAIFSYLGSTYQLNLVLIGYFFTVIVGLFKAKNSPNSLVSEFIWELPLALLGLYFFLL